MRTINVFADTSTVNKILDIAEIKVSDPTHEEDRLYLSRIIDNYVEKGTVRLIVNPSITREIEQTKNTKRRNALLAIFNQLRFTSYNKTVFPFTFPAHFVSEEEKGMLADICKGIRGFDKDEKIFLDAVSNSEIQVLLTTDRTHLANRGLNIHGILVFTPRQLFEHLQNIE